MRTIKNPDQFQLFDEWVSSLPEKIREKWLTSWEGVFRTVILEEMPVGTLSKHFHESLGCPSKEQYSMAGLVFLQEFNDWDDATAAQAYEGYQNVRFALGLTPGVSELSVRTLQRYRRYLIDEDSAMEVFVDITQKLAKIMNLKIESQRLDSTHVFSNMARFGRTQLMGVMIKRFLVQVARHVCADYEALPEELRKRYEPPRNKLFGDTGKDEASRAVLRQQVADDMHFLVKRFGEDKAHKNRHTYKEMVRVFLEQCEVIEEKVCIKKKPGGHTVQNPSDLDATFDGKKGPGYQVQLAETCSKENEQELITAVLPETAAQSDTTSFPTVVEQLKGNDLLPNEMLADSLYGVDENMQIASQHKIDMISPVKKGPEKSTPQAGDITVASFVFDGEQKRVTHCPAGHVPVSSEYNAKTNRTQTFMKASACGQCALLHQCLAKKNHKSRGYYRIYTEPRKVRLTTRRLHEQSKEFKDRYRLRAGIEATNNGLKRKTGLGRLRVRGRPRVFFSIIMKVAGWNVLRASACTKVKEFVREKRRSRLLAAFSVVKSLFPAPGFVMAAVMSGFQKEWTRNTQYQVAT